jgi:acetylglutamate kinase
MRLVVKLGGALLDSVDLRHQIAREIAEIASNGQNQIVVVHGGGKQMTRYLAERGVESRFINGLRVTTPDVIDAVVKVFAGSVNAQLVTALRAAGARPVGLSGLAAGLVDAEIVNPELGQVGKPVHCAPDLLNLLTDHHYLPVIACIAGDARGTIYNVNADQMAAACAAAFRANELLFLTDVDGVRDASGRVCATLTISEAQRLIRDGAATGGMQAKLEAAIGAIQGETGEVLIGPGARPGILREMLAGSAHGSRLTP